MFRTLCCSTLLLFSSAFGEDPSKDTDVKVLAAVQKYDPALQKKDYSFKDVQLTNKDGCKNPIVFLNGNSGYCGTGGCTILVLSCTLEGFSVISDTSVAMTPVYISSKSSNGYKDIKVHAKKKGLVILKFNGETYPTNASVVPKTKKASDDALLMQDSDVFR